MQAAHHGPDGEFEALRGLGVAESGHVHGGDHVALLLGESLDDAVDLTGEQPGLRIGAAAGVLRLELVDADRRPPAALAGHVVGEHVAQGSGEIRVVVVAVQVARPGQDPHVGLLHDVVGDVGGRAHRACQPAKAREVGGGVVGVELPAGGGGGVLFERGGLADHERVSVVGVPRKARRPAPLGVPGKPPGDPRISPRGRSRGDPGFRPRCGLDCACAVGRPREGARRRRACCEGRPGGLQQGSRPSRRGGHWQERAPHRGSRAVARRRNAGAGGAGSRARAGRALRSGGRRSRRSRGLPTPAAGGVARAGPRGGAAGRRRPRGRVAGQRDERGRALSLPPRPAGADRDAGP